MKRSRIGSVDIDVNLSFWTNGKNAGSLKQNERLLYSEIDLWQEYAMNATEDRQNDLYTKMDINWVIIQLINQFGYNDSLLYNAGAVLNNAISRGDFDYTYSSLADRNEHVNEVLANIVTNVTSNELNDFINADFMQMWNDSIIGQNFYINIATNEATKEPVASSSVIGGVETDEYCAKLKESAMYFPYVFAKARYFKTDAAMRKRLGQQEIENNLKSVNSAYQGGVSKNLILAGIYAQTQKTPDSVVETMITDTDKTEVSGAFLVLIPLILKAVIALSAVAVAILALKSENVKKETAKILSSANIEQYKADLGDWQNYDLNGDGQIDANEYSAAILAKENKKKIYLMLGIGLAAMYLLLN